jgi:hypothetical protein
MEALGTGAPQWAESQVLVQVRYMLHKKVVGETLTLRAFSGAVRENNNGW